MFKYSVTVFIQQKVGASMTYGCSMWVDNTADGQVAYPFRDNKFVDLMVCVAGYKITQK